MSNKLQEEWRNVTNVMSKWFRKRVCDRTSMRVTWIRSLTWANLRCTSCLIKSLSSPLNSTPVGPPPTTTQWRSLAFSSIDVPKFSCSEWAGQLLNHVAICLQESCTKNATLFLSPQIRKGKIDKQIWSICSSCKDTVTTVNGRVGLQADLEFRTSLG